MEQGHVSFRLFGIFLAFFLRMRKHLFLLAKRQQRAEVMEQSSENLRARCQFFFIQAKSVHCRSYTYSDNHFRKSYDHFDYDLLLS